MLKEEKGNSWYNRMAIKHKEWKEKEDEEDLSIEDWIDLMIRYGREEKDNTENTSII